MNKPKTLFLEIAKMSLIITIVSGTMWGIAHAGSLIPPLGTPSKTMYTLDDIYTLVTTGTTTPSTNFITPGSATSTFHTLSDIVHDYVAPAPGGGTHNPSTVGPFVGDGQPDNGYLDQNTGLIWQNTDSGQYLCWDDYQDCGPMQAQAYCQYLDTDGVTVDGSPQNIWRLPTVKEWLSVLDYSAGTYSTYNVATALPNTQSWAFYWTSTEYAPSTNAAWIVLSYDGYVGSDGKSANYLVRCVR